MHARSHQYPDLDDKYVDTTYYDEENEYLDIGYQRLKTINQANYPEFSYLKKLFVDYNNLEQLPNPKYLPNIEELSCSHNRLVSIPFYPKLVFLNIAYNKILECAQYHNSKIKYFDCSYNSNFCFNFKLPNCEHLYINDTDLESINLELVPKLKFLDCSNNKLKYFSGGYNLIEINIQHNNISKLVSMPNLVVLMADFNIIERLPSYPRLVHLSIQYNRLVEIDDQPVLKRIIANNNNINFVGNMPKLKLIDLSYNKLLHFNIPNKAKHVSLQFNPMNNISLNTEVLSTIRELQVNFKTYRNIYKKYYHSIYAVNIKTNEEILEKMLKKMDNILDEKLIRYIFKKFNHTKFVDRGEMLIKVTLKIYWNHFTIDKISTTLQELINKEDFQGLLQKMVSFYYKILVVTLYFNSYIDQSL
jgi:Leucine-rich repeat (LRR) protein